MFNVTLVAAALAVVVLHAPKADLRLEVAQTDAQREHGLMDRTTYQNANLADGSIDNLASDDFTDWGLKGRIAYQISPVVTPFVETVVDTRRYDDAVDANGYARTSDGVLVVRRSGTICFINPAAEALLGRNAADLVGEMFGIPLTPGEATEVDIPRARGQGGVAEMRVAEITWEGEPAYLASLRTLLALPERDRVPVVLCHLQGLTRREAAERLGCPEGTLSARLNRALRRLRARLVTPAVLAGGAVAIPTALASATVRSATIYSTSTLTAVGVSPAVVGLTDEVLRMFWMQKVMTAAVLAVLVLGAGVLTLGTASRSESTACATEPIAVSTSPAPQEEPVALKRLETRLAFLEKANTELSDVVYRQQREIQSLRMYLNALTQRLQAIQAVETPRTLEEERPPHY